MKKILFLLALLLTVFVSTQAQAIVLKGTHDNAQGLDTLSASDTIYLKNTSSLASGGLSGKYAIELRATNLSGTTGFTATLEGSTDGVNWSTGINKVPGTDGKNCDTLSVSSAGVYYITISPDAAKQLLSAGVVSQTYYTAGVTRRYYIRVKLLSGATAQSTRVSARLITQN